MTQQLEVLLLIVGSGAFGGLVDGLLFPRAYRLRLGSVSKDLGSIGDALVGAAASVAIFAFAEGIFKIDVARLNQVPEFIKVVAWGVLSGFAGLRLLQPLSAKLVEEVAGQAARKVARQEAAGTLAAAVHIRDGEALLTKFDFAKDHGWLKDRKGELAKFLDVADTKFDAALAENPGSPDALRSKAKIVRRRAELARASHDEAGWRRLMQTAIDTLSQITERHPDYALGYYNRACYRSLMGGDASVVCADLREAIRLNRVVRDLAVTDPDFTAELRRNPEFAGLIQDAWETGAPAGEAAGEPAAAVPDPRTGDEGDAAPAGARRPKRGSPATRERRLRPRSRH